ncbi:MAG: cytochrome c oxidase subunit 3 [Deltaproteobacteria bacterium]
MDIEATELTPHLAHHFQDLAQQTHAARLGMWVFLGSESLLFAALFTGLTVYRTLFGSSFALASQHLSIAYGTANTFVLITSSFTVVMSLHLLQTGRRGWSLFFLGLTLALAVAFLVVKGLEWRHDFQEGIYPGRYYAQKDLLIPGAAMFYSFYFIMTGLHGLHVVAGIGVLVWCGSLILRGQCHSGHETPLELGAMYWHLVDIIWIFLYPLLYLIT